MRFPAYWAQGTAERLDHNAKPLRFTCWGASDLSRDDAHAAAMERAGRVLNRLLSDEHAPERYPYGATPLREEVKQEFTNGRGELIAAVTTNGYGSLVLNTAGAMFVDIDFSPISPGEQLRHTIGKWFKRGGLAPEAAREQEARQRVARFLAGHEGWGARLYRTLSGLRVLVSHDLFDPAADATQRVFESLGADPMYMRLCRSQQSFRARLTPKPWRCGHTQNRTSWPRQTPEAQAAFDRWQAKYLECQRHFATCRLVEVVGRDSVHPDVEQVIAIHDKVARAGDPLPLA